MANTKEGNRAGEAGSHLNLRVAAKRLTVSPLDAAGRVAGIEKENAAEGPR